jgi:hypothetical protein
MLIAEQAIGEPELMRCGQVERSRLPGIGVGYLRSMSASWTSTIFEAH